MPEDQNGEGRPSQEPTVQKVFEKLLDTPPGEDPAYWPTRAMHEHDFLIEIRNTNKNLQEKAIGEQWAPLQETLRKVRTAYEILAYPHCQIEYGRIKTQADLETDRQARGRDQVDLNDTELRVLSKLAAVKQYPFDPQKRTYHYSEVPLSPDIDPGGKRHMSTEEIRKEFAEKPPKWKK